MPTQINYRRKAAMQRKSIAELKQIVLSGSLSAAAARYELLQREKA